VKRFFSDDSFWNTPLPSNAEVDARSDHYLALLAEEPGGPFWTNLNKFTIPIYEVDASTPRRTIHQREVPPERRARPNRWGKTGDEAVWFRHGPGFGKDVPIPENVEPDPASDAHMAMIDWDARAAWDTWACRRRDDGEWESYTGMVYSLDSDGVWKTSDFAARDGDSIHFHGPSRAAGVPAIAGLILRDEIDAGEIRHKLAFATACNAYRQFVAPAAWTDGHRDDGLPEGAVMQIDPALSPSDFGLSPAGEIIFRALQTYGMVDVDNAGGNTLYGEGLYAHPGRSWEGVLEEEEMKKVPLDCYRVLKLGEITHLGDSRRS
jgi:hypothetical protein